MFAKLIQALDIHWKSRLSLPSVRCCIAWRGSGIAAGIAHTIPSLKPAARRGDFEALLALLDPDVLVLADHAAAPLGAAMQVHGAQNVAEQALIFSRRSRFAQLAIVNGAVGVVVAPRGRLMMVMAFKFTGKGIGEIDIIADPAHLRKIDLAVLDG